VAVCAIFYGLRPEIFTLTADFAFLRKLVWILSAFALSVVVLQRVSSPIAQHKEIRIYGGGLAVFSAFVFISDLYARGVHPLVQDLSVEYFTDCAFFITAYGAVAAFILTLHMRCFAPHDLPRAGRLIGLVAGLAAGLAYALHCPKDGALYVLLAYTVPAMFLAWVSGLVLPRFLRW
jgi:hypothetical protein